VVDLTTRGRRACKIQLRVFDQHAEPIGHALAMTLSASNIRRYRHRGAAKIQVQRK
jgi:hypothetical protein